MSEQTLLDAIVAHPDDDEPRLVYADLLESRGDPRGEFIQLQCRAERTPEIEARLAELEHAHAKAWLAPILALELGARFTFRRGFVHAVQGRFPCVVEHADVLATHAPLLVRADLGIGGQRDRDRLANPRSSPVLRGLRQLRLFGKHRGMTRGFIGPIGKLDGLAALGMDRLRSLSLETLRLRGGEIRALCDSLPALEALGLHVQVSEPHEVLPYLPPLRSFELTRCTLQTAVFERWLALDHTRLETLDFGASLTAPTWVMRLTETSMPALRRLSFGYNGLPVSYARALRAWTTATIEIAHAPDEIVAALSA